MAPHDEVDVRRRAGWFPDQQEDLEQWISSQIERLQERTAPASLHPAVERLRRLSEADPIVRMYLHGMVEQEPKGKPYSRRLIRDVPQLLGLIDLVVTMAPEWSEDASVVLPLNAVLDWAMGTQAGFAGFRDRRINDALKDILDAWCRFLCSRESLYVLNDSAQGWQSESARTAVGIEQFRYDPQEEHWGFTSWNDFFTRHFRQEMRPVAAPGDDRVIVSACESTPYRIATNVQRRDEFWIKSQPYSLHDMLGGGDSVDEFVGGTVYQAFLSATNYHRWHSPVSGTVVSADVVPGTYYSEADSEGAEATEPQNSQSYLAHVATRAVIIIDAGGPIGLVGFVAVGMSDVSSCVIADAVAPGNRVTKGDELGYFQFGGSTSCLVFRPGVVDSFTLDAIPQPSQAKPRPLHVRAHLATAAR